MPAHFNHEETHVDNSHHQVNSYAHPTAPPPLRSTTLRTIIKPDSEFYHSNSGIQVTFNTESKHQSGHELQEHIEESALQPVVSDIRSPSIEGIERPFIRQSFSQNGQLNAGDRARAYEHQYANGPPSGGQPINFPANSVHRFSPSPQLQPQLSHPSSSTFLRPTADQGLLLSYTQNQANRVYQTHQGQDNRVKVGSPLTISSNIPPNHRYQDQANVLNVAPPSNSGPPKFRPQPPHHSVKPIPIPLHQYEKQQIHPGLQLPQLSHGPDFSTNYKLLRGKPQTHPNILYQQSYPQSIRPSISHLPHSTLGKYSFYSLRRSRADDLGMLDP